MTDTGAIAVIGGMESSKLQELLSSFAAECRSRGVKVAGVIAEAHGLPDRTCSAGILRSIASGKGYPIYLGEAPAGTSCHLDSRGVDAACASVLDRLKASDLVILSKFGKLEAMQGGLYPAFRAAIAAGKPVVTSVSAKHQEAWRLFAPAAASVDAKEEALADWWRSLKRGMPTAIPQ
jgi:hypothetical protein